MEVGNPGRSQTKGEISEKAIGHFHVPNDMLPWTFRLLQVKELPAWANTSCVSIRDVIQVTATLRVFPNMVSTCLICILSYACVSIIRGVFSCIDFWCFDHFKRHDVMWSTKWNCPFSLF